MSRRMLGLMGLVVGAALAPGLAPQAHAGLSFTCDPTIDSTQAGTCAYLNSTIAGEYNSTFTNANADIYIQMGITGLGSSTTGFQNQISYGTYLSDLTALGGPGVVRSDAIASLPGSEPALYNGQEVNITSALGEALGIPDTSLVGTTAGGSPCFTPGSGGCYNGIITITTPANLSAETGGTQSLFWRQNGATGPADSYDFYGVVEHETDELFGTSSCVSTGGPSLVDTCEGGSSSPSATDLYRYDAAGNRVLIDTTPGAYFSYNGGLTNGADGAIYNTVANGNDYADFTNSCTFVQDMQGCPNGQEFDVTTDGNAEINILDAIGYNLAQATQPPPSTPEPASLALFGAGLTAVGLYRRRRARAV